MIETTRAALRVFAPKGERSRWIGLVALTSVVVVGETLTAYLVFAVLRFAAEPSQATDVVALGLGIEIEIVPLLVLTGVAFLVRGGLALLNAWAQSRVVEGAAAEVSVRIQRRYLEAPYTFHLQRSSSESVRTVLWSVDSATVNAVTPLVTILIHGATSIALFGLLVAIAPALSLGALAVVAVGLGAILAFVQPALGRIGKLSETTAEQLLHSVKDAFDNVRDIKAYRAESFFVRRFRHHRFVAADIRISKLVLDQIPRTGLESLVVVGLLVVIGLAVAGDSFSAFVPILGAFGYATLRIAPSLTRTVAAANRLRFGEEAMANVERDLTIPIPTEPAPSQVTRRDGPLLTDRIDFCNVSYRYPGAATAALDRIDLTIKRGEFVAIAGGSGSGKSTLIDLLLGLLDADDGRILVDGEDRVIAGWHRSVGFVSQTVVLLDGTVRENVAFGAGEHTDDERVIRALTDAQLGPWFEGLPHGLETPVGEGGRLVSGGERQRIAVARALYREPELLILDEATSALDETTETALVGRLASMSDSLTTVMVSHRPTPIRAADRLIVLEHGRVVDSGRHHAGGGTDASSGGSPEADGGQPASTRP